MPEKTVLPPPDEAKSIGIPSYEEILGRVASRWPRGLSRDRCLSKLESTYNIVSSKTESVEKLYRLYRSLHQFYLDLVSTEFNLEELDKAFSCVFKARKLSRRFWDAYRYRILASESNKAACVQAREGVGRILSLFRRCRKSLILLKNLTVYLSKLPSVDTDAPMIIVAGAPNVGKSTFVRSVSSGRPEVASYPFTTKNVTLGHRVVMGFKVQFIDTPGLLDRPLEEMNPIERRAVAALTRLRGGVLFLIDPTRGSHLSLEAQASLLRNVAALASGKPLFLGVNKCDEADPELLEASRRLARDLVEKGVAVKYYELSAIRRESAEKVAEEVSLLTLRLLGFLSSR